MATKKNNKKKNGTLFTIACSILALLVMLIAFLVKKDQIVTNLKETSFFERVFGTTPEFVQNHEIKETKSNNEIKENPITIKIEPEKKEKEPELYIPETAKPVATVNEKEEVIETDSKEKQVEIKKETEKKASTEIQLCFVMIDGDGSIYRKMVKRNVAKSDSPLSNAINELLKGPDTTKSAERNCMSVIPEGTKLLSAKVTNGVAYLSFNERFEINPNGVEGYINQLMQIVYTATAFSTVNSVQFLIEGKKQDYLGPEGQWIGSPLSRNSF